MLNLNTELIDNDEIREALQKIEGFVSKAVFIRNEFVVFEETLSAANSGYKIAHGLKYTPRDFFVSYVSSDSETVVPVYEALLDDGSEYITINVSGPCTFRLIVGSVE